MISTELQKVGSTQQKWLVIRVLRQVSSFLMSLKKKITMFKGLSFKTGFLKSLKIKDKRENSRSPESFESPESPRDSKNWANKLPQNIDLKKSMLDFMYAISDVSRNITGQKFVEAAESLLDQQMRYNNILATRLAEALVDIESLKDQVNKLEQKI